MLKKLYVAIGALLLAMLVNTLWAWVLKPALFLVASLLSIVVIGLVARRVMRRTT